MPNSQGTTDVLPILNFDTGAGQDPHPALGLYFAAAGGHQIVDAANPLPTTAVATHTQDDDDAAASGHTIDEVLPLNYGFDASLADPSLWIREQIWKDDTAPHADQLPLRGVGAFGTVVPLLGFPTGVGLLGGGNMANYLLSQERILFTTDRNNEPFEILNSQADIDPSDSVASAAITVNTILGPGAANSLGRTVLHGSAFYTGGAPPASGLTVTVDVSYDSFATFVTVDSFSVVEGTPTVIRDLSMALAPQIRVTVTNDDAVNGATGVNIGFYLTQT